MRLKKWEGKGSGEQFPNTIFVFPDWGIGENMEETAGAEKCCRPARQYKRVTVADIYSKRISKLKKINYFKEQLVGEYNSKKPDQDAMRYYIQEIWRLRRQKAVYMFMKKP